MSMYATASLSQNRNGSAFDGLRGGMNPLRWFRRRLLRRPASTLAMSVGALFGGAILMNALAFQTERHPAPMFTTLVEDTSVNPVVGSIPAPPARPVTVERRADSAQNQPREVSRPAPAPRDDAARATAVPASAKEQMLAIIKGGAPETGDAAQRVSQIQRALNKAGYGPLKEDGVLGAGTRQALERFESDRKLPVRGEAQGRTVRELARASGIAID